MIEKNFDIPFVAELALREKQIQQNYRPIIAVHKWFARRPGTLFRALLLAEFVEGSLRENYFRANNLKGLRVADPFMGGGTPLLEANRLGCEIIGYDINPMAYWIVRQEIERLDLTAYREAARQLIQSLSNQVGAFYKTTCLACRSMDAQVKYFLWVKVQPCQHCGQWMDLFPGYLLAENQRHPKNVFVCPTCGELTETEDRKNPGLCQFCSTVLSNEGPAKRNRCRCPACGMTSSYPDPKAGPPKHRMFAIEYHCPACKPHHKGRFFKKPSQDDVEKYNQAEAAWAAMTPLFVPNEEIPPGDETDRLHRWGYRYYCEMFNARQLLGLELSCRAISEQPDERVRNALATNLSDLLRYQNMLCRYDTMALKSLDIFSVHGFPVGLVQCESNLLGIPAKHRGVNIGSGGWSNIVEKYVAAKTYCERPFEVRYQARRKVQIFVTGEWIGDHKNGTVEPERRHVTLRCESAIVADLPVASLDAVLTDPPYFGNVQYAELMDFCYVWLRRLVGGTTESFRLASTRHISELTGNATLERGLTHFTSGLCEVFSRMAKALKPGAPLAFTYHYNTIEAYFPVAVAILDAGLTCSASLPCPAEMGGSIHINGTGSSIVDTIFVCRSTGKVPRRLIAETPKEIADLVRDDVQRLCAGKVVPTHGDIRCLAFGHLIRLAIWRLRHTWDREKSVEEKLSIIGNYLRSIGGFSAVEQHLSEVFLHAPKLRHAEAQEDEAAYGASNGEFSF
ncbi:MAG TPA: DNA methylase [Alphaproteobacteria bacterium]|nr:DNA methylase [Alphaproteobacteria bacterium]